MSQIGPQMPPHLAKRKRTPEDDSDDDQNTRRVRHASPKTHGPARPVVGPAMPPQNVDEIDLSDSVGPEPELAGPEPASPALSASSSDYGPALPGESAPAAPSPSPSSDDNDDPRLHGIPRPPAATAAPVQRDDWMLAPPTDDASARAVDPTKIRARKFATGRAAVAASMHSVSDGGAAASAIGSLWTETTEQKAQRLADTVLGRKPDPRQGGDPRGSSHTTTSTARKAVAQEAQIQAYTEATRGRSLYETHQESLKNGEKSGEKSSEKSERHRDRDRDRHRHRHRHESGRERHESRDSRHEMDGKDSRDSRHDRERHSHRHKQDEKRSSRKQEKEDDPSARAFDRDKDMGLGVHINHKQRRELLNRASDFGGRFQKGSYL